jgi:peptidoglycan/LPS O-acetylase OafA/YrhL
MGLIRIFLALVVAADHWQSLLLGPMGLSIDESLKLGFDAGSSVFFFYVISGFLITYALQTKYGHSGTGVAKFYQNRFIRIFSLYWPMVVVALLTVGPAWSALMSADLADKLTGLFIFGMDWRIAFSAYPELHFEAAIRGLQQAWTLGAELVFYALAPLLMRSVVPAIAVALLSLALRFFFVASMGPALHSVWTYVFFGTAICFFMFGHLICRAAERWKILQRPWLAVIFLAGSFMIMVAAPYKDFDSPRFWLAISCFTMSLPGLFHATKNSRWMNYMGDLSYPVYLVHVIVFMWIGGETAGAVFSMVGKSQATAPLASLAFLLLVLCSAIVAHHILEKPAARIMRFTSGCLRKCFSAQLTAAGRGGARQEIPREIVG